jgi:predicted dehydrogenase
MMNVGIHSGNEHIKAYIDVLKKAQNSNSISVYLNPSVHKSIKVKGIRQFEHFDAFLEQCEVVFFLNYTSSHFDYVIKSLKASKHIFFESIDRLDLSEANEFLKLSAEANVVFKIGLKDTCLSHIESDLSEFDNPLLIESFIHKKPDSKRVETVVFTEELKNVIFQVIQSVKGNVKRINARSISIGHAFDDVLFINLEFDNGSIATFSINFLSEKPQNSIAFFKHEKMLLINNDKKELSIKRKGEKKVVRKKFFNRKNPLIPQVNEFFSGIEKGSGSRCSIEAGVKVLDVLGKIMEKIRISSNPM